MYICLYLYYCAFVISLFPFSFQVHPQPEDYWGHVNTIGPRACYDEGKRVAETMCYAYARQVSTQYFVICFCVHIFVHF